MDICTPIGIRVRVRQCKFAITLGLSLLNFRYLQRKCLFSVSNMNVALLRVPNFFIPWNSLIFPWFLKIFPWFFLSFYEEILVKRNIFILFNVASNCHWGSVYTNTNLLQIHFPKVKPPHLKSFFSLTLKGWKWFWKKSSLISKFFPWFWLKTPCFSLISLTGKSLQNFPCIPWFSWSVGALLTSHPPVMLS